MFLSFELLIIFSFIILLFLIPFKLLSPSSKTPRNPPPSPQKLPIIGNLHQLGSSPHRSLRAISEKHGPLLLVHLGNVPLLLVSSAEAAKEVLKTHDLVFSNRLTIGIPKELTYGFKGISFAPYGESWRQMKSITMIHLLSHKRVQSFQKIREKETIRMIKMIEKSCGCVVDLSEMVFLVINNVICEVALGKAYNDSKFKDMMLRVQILLGAGSIGSYIPWLFWVDWVSGLKGRVNKVAKEFDEFLEGVIEEHIKKNIGGEDEGKEDLVDMLLDVRREDATKFTFEKDTIKAVIFDVFVAGTDTTSTTIEWALSELVRHPHIMKKLQTEVTNIAQGRSMITEDDIHKMHYLKAVLKETLRLHIPAPLVSRESREDVKVMGYDIAQGTQVMVNAWAIARDPLLWEEPDKFNPERFLNSSIDYKGFDFELLPFGTGRRRCPGIEFAMVISELVIANIVFNYDLALPNEERLEELDMSEIYGITVHKRSHLLVVPSLRLE